MKGVSLGTWRVGQPMSGQIGEPSSRVRLALREQLYSVTHNKTDHRVLRGQAEEGLAGCLTD